MAVREIDTRVQHADTEDRIARLQDDVAALASIDRRATRAGERRSAEWVARRLRVAGARDIELQSARAMSSWAWTNIGHALAGVAAARVGGPMGPALALGAIVSYEADYTGRSKWMRRLIPGGTTTNVMARIPARGARRRTLVLVAHHDAAHTGWIWHPQVLRAFRAVAGRTGTTPAYSTPFYLALAACGSRRRGLRLVGAVQLGVYIVLSLQAAFSRTAPGANDNATGVAALLELACQLADEPLAGTEVMLVFPGAEEVGVDGMAAWIRAHRRRFDPARTLVVGLDSLGGGQPTIVERESWSARYRARDLVWADLGAERAGLDPPIRVRLAVNTDPMAARHAGLPAISLLSTTEGWLGRFHRMDDVPANVDWGSVIRCTRLAFGIAQAYADGGDRWT